MKNIIFLSIFLAFIACQNQEPTNRKMRNVEEEPTTLPTIMQAQTYTSHVHVYACPMHPEITGKVGNKCSKCGMALVHHD